ncbi:hypothetical protein [Frankia sp. CiP3]|uniref:hypothetical protein n=1 Tax=Frankia sp. CiP3 TaxID=2880971 RepID=UPI001EF6BCB9|nr:hypothetical protein [Frankia sp. CiP3]
MSPPVRTERRTPKIETIGYRIGVPLRGILGGLIQQTARGVRDVFPVVRRDSLQRFVRRHIFLPGGIRGALA